MTGKWFEIKPPLSLTTDGSSLFVQAKRKGTPKADVCKGVLEVGFGLKGDAHGGDWHRQVSLLAIEQIETMKNKGYDVQPGSFAENICTEGFDLGSVFDRDEAESWGNRYRRSYPDWQGMSHPLRHLQQDW